MPPQSQIESPRTGRLTASYDEAPTSLLASKIEWFKLPALESNELARMVLTAVAYYVGGRIGFLLQSPAVPQSVLWLPNSILLVVLLVSPVRSWPLVFLAAFPAQWLVGWQNHAPLLTISLIYLTNCADAALAATLWRLVSPNESRVYGLRAMIAFLVVGATIPTLLLSFADAAITVARHWSNQYWLVFETRARANILTNVIFVPAAVSIVRGERADFVRAVKARWVEGGVLFVGLVGASILASSRPADSVSTPALVYLPLVFVVWAAVRFNLGMTGASLLALAYLTTWVGMRDIHTGTHADVDFVAGVQFELLAIAVPVLCLSAVVEERERGARALAASQRALNQSLAQIRNLAGRLLSATEVERTRIARELHDDICQQLAALGIGLSALKRHMPNDFPLRGDVNMLQLQAMRVAEDIRVLSHDLHPAALRHAGLVPAMRELCAQYGREGTIRAVFAAKREVDVSLEIALCVYRVTQEALRNAARHSGAETVYVTLRSTDDWIELSIEDDGRGFDEQTARTRGGLGLTSMDERVRLVGGMVSVDSSPGRGARIHLRVPNRESNGSADTATG